MSEDQTFAGMLGKYAQADDAHRPEILKKLELSSNRDQTAIVDALCDAAWAPPSAAAKRRLACILFQKPIVGMRFERLYQLYVLLARLQMPRVHDELFGIPVEDTPANGPIIQAFRSIPPFRQIEALESIASIPGVDTGQVLWFMTLMEIEGPRSLSKLEKMVSQARYYLENKVTFSARDIQQLIRNMKEAS
ncbi:MAG: hypothetical protein KGI69_02865 [Patescibacteria group bacterium]|nr:hypothetical protein [Patescibacteria group bacterium]